MGKLIAIFLISVSTVQLALTQTSEDLWKSASEQYVNGDYSGSAATYRLIEGEVVSSELYFNLGNCYYQLDSTAKAILNFEKAIKLNPRNKAARENLRLAVDLMVDPIPAIEEFFLKRWLNGLSELLPPVGWGLLSIASLWLAAWFLVRSVRRDLLKTDLVRYLVPLAVFLFCIAIGYIAFVNQTDSDYAIVMESLAIRVAPDELSAVSRTITEGEKVMIIDELEDYYKVRFVNYEHGWIPKAGVRRI